MIVRVGSSIPCLDEQHVKAIEPNAPIPSARLDALRTLSEEGVPVYISMSPTYPTQGRAELEELMQRFAEIDPEVVFHEPINPRGSNFRMTIDAAREAGEEELADGLEQLLDQRHWVEYSLNHMNWVEELGEEYDVDVHIWPDKQVISSVDSSIGDLLKEKRQKPSPEQIPDLSPPN